MGEHKHNKTAIEAKLGLLPPKAKPMYSKRQMDAMIYKIVEEKLISPEMKRALAVEKY